MEGILGIDPGQKGGIAWISESDSRACKIPETERDIFECLKCAAPQTAFCFLERVHAMPAFEKGSDGKRKRRNVGTQSMFTFGRGYGFLRGCLVALEIPFDEVTPQKWQRALACLTKGDKNVSKAKAQQLFPNLKVTHSTADALLIAEYGRRLRQGVL